MDVVMNLNRRGFIGGLIASVAAPAIVKAEILMPIKPTLIVGRNNLLTIEITREAVRLFKNTNWYLDNSNEQYDKEFYNVNIGSTLRIRLPHG